MILSWVKQLAFLGVFLTLLSIILPNGKISKYIKSIFYVVMFLVILQPILNVKSDGVNLLENISVFNGNNIQIQEEYLDLVFDNKNQKNERLCKTILDNYGVKYSKLKINFSNKKGEYKIEKITLDLCEYYSMLEHKDIIESAKKDITTALKIEVDKIIINE